MSKPRPGTKIRIKEPDGVPDQLHGEEVKVIETQKIGASSYAVRVRDPFEFDGPTERDEDEFAQDHVHCPFSILPKDYEVVEDD